MDEIQFDLIRHNNRLIYEYIRGSHAYGTNIETSDKDTAGIYLCDPTDFLGLGYNYKEQISDRKSDNVWWELKRFIHLALKGNPNTLEALWIPERCILYKNPIMDELISMRNEFLSKDVFDSITGFAISQIRKARGLNKKIVNPVDKLKGLLDFCYVVDTKSQGSKPLIEYLDEHGLKQEYCGLVNIPHMNDLYNVFYGEHYKGIANENSQDVLLSSVDKGSKPIFQLSFNRDGYRAHLKQYTQYQNWVKERNEARYLSNLNQNYDSKNMMHCFRILNMGIELAETGELNIDRTDIDREFLLKIRNHEFEYDELIEKLDKIEERLEFLKLHNNLPEAPNVELFDKFLIKVRKQQLGY